MMAQLRPFYAWIVVRYPRNQQMLRLTPELADGELHQKIDQHKLPHLARPVQGQL